MRPHTRFVHMVTPTPQPLRKPVVLVNHVGRAFLIFKSDLPCTTGRHGSPFGVLVGGARI